MQVEDVSPNDANFIPRLDRTSQSLSGKALCVAVSDDGRRAYLGGHSGVWRSDTGGATWWHPEWPPPTHGGPTPPGALTPINVYDLVIDPTNSDVVFAGTGRDGREPSAAGIYRSQDGARSWRLVHQFVRPSGRTPRVGTAGRLAAVSDDPRTLYAAGEGAVAWSTDSGDSWTERVPRLGSAAFHVVAGPRRRAGRRVYAVGFGVWYSLDGGLTWHIDPAPRVALSITDAAGPSARALAIHPRFDNVIYLMQDDLTLWKGEYPDAPSTGAGTWTQLPAPPVAGGSDSGGTFIVPHVTPEGLLVLYASDRRSVHGAGGEPSTQSEWTHVEDGHCHLDPHDLALTPDFRPWAPDVFPPTSGRAVLVNDGGVNVSTDGMQTWFNGTGLSTLNVVNVGVNSVRGGPTAITFGAGDNCGFSYASKDATWTTQDYLGGDNDCSFSDPMQPTRMVLFAPRSKAANGVAGEIYLFVSHDTDPPETAIDSHDLQRIPAPPPVQDANGKITAGWNVVSYYFNYGYRPLVPTLADETPRPDGDLITIRFTGVIGVDYPLLLRTTAISTIAADSDWVTVATTEAPGGGTFQVGPPLPDPMVSSVQASGGHETPTFYVGNTAPTVDGWTGSQGLWKLAPGDESWVQIVPARLPGRGPSIARRFYVNPYRPDVVYVLGSDHVYRSEDGGVSWTMDAQLERVVTENGAFPFDAGSAGNPDDSVLKDMQFDAYRPGFRLATGVAGVFYTDDGHAWEPLLRSTAVAMQPTSITYDWIPCDRAVYVGTGNRGLLRLSPLPPDWEFSLGSLQAAEGVITLLRVHDPGTGYGPPDDFLDAEVIVWVDTQPEKAFGFQLRDGSDRPVAEGMLAVLRDCFNRGQSVRLEFIRTGCRTGQIIRIIEPT